MSIGSQAIDPVEIFRTCSPRSLCEHEENGTWNMEEMVNLDIRTLALNPVGYLGSSFAHLLPGVSRSSYVIIPPLTFTWYFLW